MRLVYKVVTFPIVKGNKQKTIGEKIFSKQLELYLLSNFFTSSLNKNKQKGFHKLKLYI